MKKITLAILGMLLLVGVIVSDKLMLFSVISPFTFNGFTFQDYPLELDTPLCYNSGYSGDVILGSTITISAQGSNRNSIKKISTDVTGIDEILVIYEGYGSCDYVDGFGHGHGDIGGSVVGSTSGVISIRNAIPSCNQASSVQFEPNVWKFKNNFDGTWSALESLGVGDIYIEKGRQTIQGTPTLELFADAGSGCGQRASGSATMTIYNIVRKENAFAICKADEYLTTDENGKQICKSLATIVLNSEEAIKESYDEKFARIEEELQAKYSGLQTQIDLLLGSTNTADEIAQLQKEIESLKSMPNSTEQITKLQFEIDTLQQSAYNLNLLKQLQEEITLTKAQLNLVVTRDPSVVNSVETNAKIIDLQNQINVLKNASVSNIAPLPCPIGYKYDIYEDTCVFEKNGESNTIWWVLGISALLGLIYYYAKKQ